MTMIGAAAGVVLLLVAVIVGLILFVRRRRVANPSIDLPETALGKDEETATFDSLPRIFLGQKFSTASSSLMTVCMDNTELWTMDLPDETALLT
jgi:hypothetical protein